jgi:hypothetical protein
MWGAKLYQRRSLIEELTRDLLLSGQDQYIDTDQQLLDRIFWPKAQYDVVLMFIVIICDLFLLNKCEK